MPQESILGPLLFALYINDLPKILTGASYMLYADNAQIYLHFSINELYAGLELVQQNAQATADWVVENGLELNTKKTQVMIEGSAQYLAMLQDPHEYTSVPKFELTILYSHMQKQSRTLKHSSPPP